MRVSTLLALAGLTAAGSAWANPATSKGDPSLAKPIAEQICAACHGADGNSAAAANPVLAGQHPEYTFKQLLEFKNGTRKDATMAPMVATLSEQDMKNLAVYFSQQKPKLREAPDPKLQERGQKIYRGGVAESKVPACMACHGPTGNGIPSQYARLGSQHAGYIEKQMLDFKKGTRTNHQIMTDIAVRMSDDDIKAVSNYISGLR